MSNRKSYSAYVLITVSLASLAFAAWWFRARSIPDGDPSTDELAEVQAENSSAPTAPASGVDSVEVDAQQVRYVEYGRLAVMWDQMEAHMREPLKPTSSRSNIMPRDYAGPEACAECHKENYSDWSQHSHRWMNAVANSETVRGDFSGKSTIQYLGGTASFFVQDGEFRMRFERQDLQREYRVTQTIGSRFYQYYVGVGTEGPEPATHDYYKEDFVLPFGYWLDRQAWVPIVHVFPELAEEERWESVEELKPPASAREGIDDVGVSRGVVDHSQELDMIYARSCNFCHTTFALGDLMIRNPRRVGPSLTEGTLLEMSQYVAKVHPELWNGSSPPEQFSSSDLKALIKEYVGFDAREHGITLGISCEACHLGCREHAEDERAKTAFKGQSPHLFVFRESTNDSTRSQANVNAACGRCHAGSRPTYAGGMSTWNSTEHTDALRGSCYSELSCIHCHDPHQPIGKVWKHTAEQDDASCLSCHAELKQPSLRLAHTHHPAGSPGDRCLNCHMPRINEGMQDVVRTHTIFSPTQPDMIEANQPNACNLCHLDKNIDWTVEHLQEWYKRSYNERKISLNYADRSAPVGVGWLEQSHEPTRLVASEAFARQKAKWGLPSLIKLLDDPFLMNRQFAQTAIESLTDTQLDQEFGYWYYMTADEREPLISEIRTKLSR